MRHTNEIKCLNFFDQAIKLYCDTPIEDVSHYVWSQCKLSTVREQYCQALWLAYDFENDKHYSNQNKKRMKTMMLFIKHNRCGTIECL